MSADDQTKQELEWVTLYDKIKKVYQRFSGAGSPARGDYWLLDENWGTYRHEVEIQNLDLLKPHVVHSLQAALVGFPDWEIAVGIDVTQKYKGWPAMGIVIRDDDIIDKLQRQYLPKALQNVEYAVHTRRQGTR